MNVLIIGGGAIGCMLAARMGGAGHAVTLAVRPQAADAIGANGVRLIEADGRVVSPPARVARGLADAFSVGTAYDLAVVSVKAYDTDSLAAELAATLPEPLPLLSVQNGVGNEEALAAVLDGPVLAGALTTPVEVLAPGQVRIARASHRFAIAPGPKAGETAWVAGLFQQAGFATQSFADWRALKWCKLLMNILANAQAAILGLAPAEIFAQPALGNLEVEAWREAMAVMQAQGIEPVPLAGYPLPIVVPLVRHMPTSWVRPWLGRVIAGGRGAKQPSLTYDLSPAPRGRSEVAWLNGAVAAKAHDLGLPTPINDTLTRVLLDLVEGRVPIDSWKRQPRRLLDEVERRRRG